MLKSHILKVILNILAQQPDKVEKYTNDLRPKIQFYRKKNGVALSTAGQRDNLCRP